MNYALSLCSKGAMMMKLNSLSPSRLRHGERERAAASQYFALSEGTFQGDGIETFPRVTRSASQLSDIAHYYNPPGLRKATESEIKSRARGDPRTCSSDQTPVFTFVNIAPSFPTFLST